MLVNIGDKSFKDGFKIIASHIDSLSSILRAMLFYEAEEMGILRTKIYGGIKKYQWSHSLANTRRSLVKRDGKLVNRCHWEDAHDPVFTVNDLLIHLAQDQVTKPATK